MSTNGFKAEPANITQRQAIKMIRAATGCTIETCRVRVANMPKKKDGQLMKVNRVHVAEAIEDLNAPPPKFEDIGIRPPSAKQLRAIAGN